jgi:hypothetical protein
MCEFVDDKASVFPFEELQRCMVDAMEEWEDFAPFADRPFGLAWSGLAMTRHTPATAPDAWYSRRRWLPVASSACWSVISGKAWICAQAESIRELTEKYNVEYIGIDATGSVRVCSSLCAHSTRQRAPSATRRK